MNPVATAPGTDKMVGTHRLVSHTPRLRPYNLSTILISVLFGGVFVPPFEMIGQAVETSYFGVAPINISGRLSGTGVYRFDLMDYGDLLGSSAVYLNTNCALDATTQVCHRNNGRSGEKTLTIGESAVASHLAHGDTPGPCAKNN